MSKYFIPEKEKCPPNGYSVNFSKATIDEFCNNPELYKKDLFKGAINDAITIYKYSDYISKEWIEYVLDRLSDN